MSDYTIKNLSEIEDQAPKFGVVGMETRFARNDLGLEQVGLSYQRIAPGARSPFGHRHAKQEEVYVVVEGDGRVRLDDEISDVSRWDAIRVAPGVLRAFEAGPDGIAILAVGAHALAPDDRGEMVNDWWTG